jgi:hypothetical protein
MAAKKSKAPGSPKKLVRNARTEPVRVSARQAGKTVGAYVGGLPDAQKDGANAIRAIVRETAPEASESIKWGRPVYERGGPFAYMKAAKAHLTFGFWRGTELTDPDGLLQGAGDRMRHLKIVGRDIPSEAIRAFVKQAVALNSERGDPTRRG